MLQSANDGLRDEHDKELTLQDAGLSLQMLTGALQRTAVLEIKDDAVW